MKFIPTNIADVFTIVPQKIEDERGFFVRTFCKREFLRIGFQKEFVQFNHSATKKKGTIRGIHFQEPPSTEYKLIRCIKGAVYDVAIDLRKGSSTFLKSFTVELNEENMSSILIPDGFGHGFQTLCDDCELIYHHTNFYQPNSERGLRYDDPFLKINWPLPLSNISDRDMNHSYLNENFKGITL